MSDEVRCARCDMLLDEATDGTFTDSSGEHMCEWCWEQLDPPEEEP